MRKPNENHPLAGTRILVGRARHQAGSLSASLRSLGASGHRNSVHRNSQAAIVRSHSITRLKNLKTYDWLILTSANGVEAHVGAPPETPHSADEASSICRSRPSDRPPRSAIVKHGLKVKMVPEEYVAESVVKGLRDKVNGKRVLLVRAKVARDVIPDALRAAGAHVDVVEAYETVVPEKSTSASARADEE